MSIAKGDRVSYTVMYHDGRGMGLEHIEHRTEYGRVTSTWPADAPAMARIAVENPRAGRARYVTRKVRDIAAAPPGEGTPPGAAAPSYDDLLAFARDVAGSAPSPDGPRSDSEIIDGLAITAQSLLDGSNPPYAGSCDGADAEPDGDLATEITAAVGLILAAAGALETAARRARRDGHPQAAGQLENYTIPSLRRWGGRDPGQPGNLPQLLAALEKEG